MKKTSLPYTTAKPVKGKIYNYFRKVINGKEQNIRLPDDPDSEEYSKVYWEIRTGKYKRKVKNSWDTLIAAYYKSPEYTEKADSTKKNYRRHCEAIREKNGRKDFSKFRRSDAIAVRDVLAGTWSKANERVAVLSILLKFAVDREWLERNPIVNVKKLKGGEYEAWPDSKLRAFEKACDATDATTARTIYELAIGTGQRIGDCMAMRWDHFDGEYMTVKQEKTGEPLQIYCPTRLRSYLKTLTKQGAHILARNLTQPMGKRAAQKDVEKIRLAIGVMRGPDRLVPHGWRYTAAKQLADAGCSDTEIQAVTGHRTLEMVQKYRKQAGQRQASKRAQGRRDSLERNMTRT